MNWNIDNKSPRNDFERIAKSLLNEHIIVNNQKYYRLTEIEIYFRSVDHSDEFAYKHELQLTTGNWFVHWSGIDITCGRDDIYGGILLRGAKEMIKNASGEFVPASEKYINGPLNVQAALLHMPLSVKGDSIFNLKLKEHKLRDKETVYRGPRQGLSKVHQGEAEKYRFDLLRFVIDMSPKHKFSNKSLFESI